MWFVKSKRAQTSDDDETWLRGGVVPTLNAFDIGDTRATVIILMREREGKAGGGKGFLLAEDKAFTLATSNFHTVFILDGTRVGDVRVYEDSVMQTVIQRWGTGGGNVPMIFRINDERELEKQEIQTSIVDEGAPTDEPNKEASTVVAFSPSSFANYSEGMGTLRAGMTTNNSPLAVDIYNHSVSQTNQTLRKGSGGPDHTGVILTEVAFDTFNQTVSDKNQTIKAHSANNENIGTVFQSSVVRRLTPTECERLQGCPDGWTDGQADSHRYKQMGNAVAVPVVQWIINRIIS